MTVARHAKNFFKMVTQIENVMKYIYITQSDRFQREYCDWETLLV